MNFFSSSERWEKVNCAQDTSQRVETKWAKGFFHKADPTRTEREVLNSNDSVKSQVLNQYYQSFDHVTF